MAKKLLSRKQFGELAGSAPSSITKACKAKLAPACVGKKIDPAHPAAVAYIAKREDARAFPVATGLDPKYEEAVEFCQTSNRYSIAGIQEGAGVSRDRARRIVATMKANGLIPEKGEPVPKIIPAPKPQRYVRGHQAKKNTKKAEALASMAEEIADDINKGQVLHEVPEDIEAFADMTLRELIQRFGTDTAFCDWLKATKDIEDINTRRIKSAQLRGELVSRKLIKIGVIDPIDAAHIRLLTDVKKTIAIRGAAMVLGGKDQEELEAFISDQITSVIRPIKSKIARALRDA